MSAARLERCYCAECLKLDRRRLQGIAGTFQAKLFAGCNVVRRADPSPAPPAPIADVGDLPLFGGLEPSLF